MIPSLTSLGLLYPRRQKSSPPKRRLEGALARPGSASLARNCCGYPGRTRRPSRGLRSRGRSPCATRAKRRRRSWVSQLDRSPRRSPCRRGHRGRPLPLDRDSRERIARRPRPSASPGTALRTPERPEPVRRSRLERQRALSPRNHPLRCPRVVHSYRDPAAFSHRLRAATSIPRGRTAEGAARASRRVTTSQDPLRRLSAALPSTRTAP